MRLLKKSICFFICKSLLLPVSLLIFLFPQSSETDNDDPNFLSRTFQVDFSRFSPAFAAFEDEFLFEQVSSFQTHNHIKEAGNSQKQTMNQILSNMGFDGEIPMKNISELTGPEFQSKKPQKKRNIPDSGELGSGPLVAMVKEAPVSQKPVSKTFQNPGTGKPYENRKNYRIHGDISLKEGLAFMGTMEVQWVLGKQILKFGSINIEKATYEIRVDQLIGDIVVSLYDQNNRLTGEGFFGVDQVLGNSYQIFKNLDVFPVNWDHAGHIIDGHSLTSSKNKNLSGVTVSLYGFDEQTKTDKNGQFRFHDWKKINSRSIAMASKSGHYDSLFIIDSRQPVSIPLFSESYMQAFFSYLKDQGITNPEQGGTVYGSILGVREKSGYRVSIGNKNPIYFLTSGFADTEAAATSNNGLFSFVGLKAGDYQLFIEKNGKIVDQKWIVVESSKVSTIFHRPQKTEKYPELYNAMAGSPSFKENNLNFFDNDDFQILNQEPVKTHGTTRHLKPPVLGFSSDQDQQVEKSFISHHKSLQKAPLIFDEKLHQLAKKRNMKLENGLIFGFIDSPEKYQVAMLEETTKKVIYFNEKAEEIDPDKEIAFGFIMSGFSKGLSSLAIQTDKMVLATDLVFSDHRSISVINTEVSPVSL